MATAMETVAVMATVMTRATVTAMATAMAMATVTATSMVTATAMEMAMMMVMAKVKASSRVLRTGMGGSLEAAACGCRLLAVGKEGDKGTAVRRQTTNRATEMLQ
jgi:hypothetical protein